jgi:ADP-ribose pyrophosphatase
MSDWQLISQEKIFSAPYGVQIDNWKFMTHRAEEHDFIIRREKDFIILFAITEKNEVLVLHEYFPANKKKLVSLVGGIVDEGFNHRETAEKELLEETGYGAEDFVYLGELSRGKYSSGIMYSYLATGAKKIKEQDLEPTEDIQLELVPLDKFRNMLKNNEIGCVFEVATSYQSLDHLDKF